ncbi:hypothetical protein B0H14DRAFT_3883742 [Mycena olivaceomarginata]|nr:hypothetical protein B0H14DRAFT_3883742 [Mycena olivaceomarginata]
MPIELMRRVLVAVKSWLKRSGAVPLSLSVKIFPDTVATRRTAQFLEFLMKSSSRWKTITLTGNESVEKFLAVSRTSDRFPILEEITIRMHTGGPNARMWDLLRVPTPRRVSLKFDILQPLELPLLWAELTDLELNFAIPWHRDAICLTVAGAIELLQRCRRPQNCTLHVVHRGVPPATLPIVTLRSMHSLCLFQSFGVTCLLGHVLMPNLRIFKLRHHRIQSGGVDTLLSLNNLLGVSSKLHALDLFLNCITQDCLLESLPALASITHLTITGFSMRNEPVANNSLPLAVFDNNILRLLTETSGSGSAVHRLCPLLESNRMEQMEAISDAALLELSGVEWLPSRSRHFAG